MNLCRLANHILITAINNLSAALHVSSKDCIKDNLITNIFQWKKQQQIFTYQTKDCKDTEIKIGAQDGPANLRLFETFYLKKHQPYLNPREERSELEGIPFKMAILVQLRLFPRKLSLVLCNLLTQFVVFYLYCIVFNTCHIYHTLRPHSDTF